MRTFLGFCLLCLHITASFATFVPHPDDGVPDEPRLLIVFGDSYADTGNTGNTTSAWRAPYGTTWPGSPSGRFSNGLVETDVLAAALGVPSPTPYAQLSVQTPISGGVNFAVGGSAATYAYGAPDLETQVGWFAGLVNAGVFTPEALHRALVFVSVVGNDYAAYNGSELEGYFRLMHEVPRLIDVNLRTLYSLGARNFIVSSLSPLPCLPLRTFPSGYAECEKNATVDLVVSSHNHFLGHRLKNITRNLEHSSVLYLQQTKAMKFVLNHLSEFNLTQGLKPCCVGKCSSVDEAGNPLFTVCENPDDHFFWDGIHPTQAGWRAIMHLYTRRSRFTTLGSGSVGRWVANLCS